MTFYCIEFAESLLIILLNKLLKVNQFNVKLFIFELIALDFIFHSYGKDMKISVL